MDDKDYHNDYKVRKINERDIPTGKKLKLSLVENPNTEDEIVRFEQWVSYSTWQLEDGDMERRMQEWADKRIKELEEDTEPMAKVPDEVDVKKLEEQ